MIIREHQMESLAESGRIAFEGELVEHSHRFAPDLCRVAGRTNVTAAVRKGLRKGELYGFTLRGPLRFYVELMLSLGSDFDTDPQLAWASEGLRSTERDELLRADRLFVRMNDYYDRVMGPGNQHAMAALRKAAAAGPNDFERLRGSFEDKVRQLLDEGFPEKSMSLGASALAAILQKSEELCVQFSVTSEAHRAFFAVLMFSFGHGVTEDGLYPWVGTTLRDSLVEKPEERIIRLQRKVRIYAESAVVNLDRSKGAVK